MTERHENIDHLFKNGLEGFEPAPSPKVWQGVSRGLSWHEFIKFNFSNFTHNVFLIAGSVATAVIVTVASYMIWSDSRQPDKPVITSQQPATTTPQQPELPGNATQIPETSPAVVTAAETRTPEAVHPGEKIVKDEISRETEESPAETQREISSISTISPLSAGPVALDDTTRKDFWTRTWDKIAGLEGFYKYPGHFNIGVLSGYDHFVQPMGDKTNDAVFNSNTNQLRFRYDSYGFQVETGLVLNKWEDKGLYNASYRAWDTIYSYERVDYFIPDPSNPDSVILITTTVYVCDSVTKTTTLTGTNKFTYLTIPVQFGYKIADYGRFGLTAWVGGAISFESSRKIGQPVIPSGIRTRVSYTDVTPERRTQWFMYSAGLRFDIMLNRRIQLEIEPYYRAYRHSLYKTGELANPHSVGINAGLSVIF